MRVQADLVDLMSRHISGKKYTVRRIMSDNHIVSVLAKLYTVMVGAPSS